MIASFVNAIKNTMTILMMTLLIMTLLIMTLPIITYNKITLSPAIQLACYYLHFYSYKTIFTKNHL